MSRVPLESGEVDLVHGVVRRVDGVKQLTLHQLDLLRYLVARPHQTVPREELLREAWGWRGAVVRSRAADFAVLRIRACIERDAKQPRHLLAEAGVGYRFEPLGAEAAPPVLQPPGARFDPQWYVSRPEAEREAALRLGVAGAPLVFTAPRGFGKTWSLAHALRAEITPEDAGVELDLDACDAHTLASTEAFGEHLALSLAEALDGDADARFAAAWSASGTPFHRLSRLTEQVLAEVPRLFLVIDHADRLRRTPGGATLFGLLRAWASRGRAPWDRLRLVLAVSTEPALIVDDAISPFNLSVPIALGPFERARIDELVARHGLPDTWVEPVWTWTRGHPTLARIACYAASRGSLTVDTFDTDGGGGVFADHLRSRLVRLQARPELARAVRAVIAGAAPASDAAERLVAAGLLVRTRGGYELQNPLTASFLARWL